MGKMEVIPISNVQAAVSSEEWQTRIHLAACYRLMAAFGMTDLIYNHISARIPGTAEHYLINPYGMLYEEMTASSVPAAAKPSWPGKEQRACRQQDS